MKILFKRLALFLLIPLIIIIILIIGYLVTDPFRVLYKYDSYSIAEINLNRDYISTETLLSNYEKEGYNSFILGSSRAMGYNPASWKTHLGLEASTYSYDAYNETLFGIYRKLLLLEALNIPIDNVLLLIDNEEHFFLTYEDDGSCLYKKHPLILGNTAYNRIDFQLSNVFGYLSPKFFIPYYTYLLTGKTNKLIGNDEIDIKYPENWMNSPLLEKRTREDSSYFDAKTFYKRESKSQIQKALIDDAQREMLVEIKRIFDANNTDYKIIINPLYNQIKLNPSDLYSLEEIFGKKNVYDFSGINQFTDSKYNYYEKSHFRPVVGDSIMNIIYKR